MENFKVITHMRFGKVRRMELENLPWYVGRNIANILGYSKLGSFVIKHVPKTNYRKMLVRASIPRTLLLSLWSMNAALRLCSPLLRPIPHPKSANSFWATSPPLICRQRVNACV